MRQDGFHSHCSAWDGRTEDDRPEDGPAETIETLEERHMTSTPSLVMARAAVALVVLAIPAHEFPRVICARPVRGIRATHQIVNRPRGCACGPCVTPA